MTFKEARDVYWKYYISLENQLMESAHYVELDYLNNGKTYSMEYLQLFQAVCSEIDVIGKVLASCSDYGFKASKTTGINEWWYYVSNNDLSLSDHSCTLLGETVLQPWKNYKVVVNDKKGAKRFILDEYCNPKANTPSWWKDYNSVKHDRTGKNDKNTNNYVKANLRNVFLAFSALYILEVKLMETIYRKDMDQTISIDLESKLFNEVLSFYTCRLKV